MPNLPGTGAKSGIEKSITATGVLAVLLAGCAATLTAQTPLPLPTSVTLPKSSVSGPQDAGVRAHTYLQFLGSGSEFTGKPNFYGPPFGPGLFYETPASIACIYGLQPAVAGCNPYSAFANPNGGRKAIAIVDAYDNPNIVFDMQIFIGQFGVPAVNPTSFIVVYAPPGGTAPGSCSGPATRPPPAAGTGWDIEASLDVQYAHAMAPLANLYLVEAQSNLDNDLYCAVSLASSIVAANGGGEVSMSWGGPEDPTEIANDGVFTKPNVVYFASTGDGPGTQYPSVSPNVVAVGGTTLSRNHTTGNFRFENTWQSGGGGISLYESRPGYQSSIAALVGTQRGVPDISAVANPFTGVWVFNSSFVGFPAWFIVGGTSVASPVMAGITNAAGNFYASSRMELSKLYTDPATDFTDITYGVCGPFQGDVAASGWDLCTGRGSPNGYLGK
jgi:subtilase family serine protease